jgi:hypothetical protein
MFLAGWSPVIEAAAQTVQAVVVVVAAVYAYGQVRESRATRRADITLQLLARLNDQSVTLRKRRLYRVVAKRINRPRESDKRLLSQIANEYHAIGYVLKLGLIDREVILGIHYAAVCRAWKAMEPWVMSQRAERGTLYGEYFEYLRDEAKEYMRLTRPDEYASQTW